MKKTFLYLLGILLIATSVWAISYFFYFSKHPVIPPGETLEKNIELKQGTLTLQENSTLKGNVSLRSGWVHLAPGAQIIGSITLGQGDLILQKNNSVAGSIRLNQGELTLGENSQVQGDLFLEKGNLIVGKQSHLSGSITVKTGEVMLKERVHVQGDVQVEQGTLKKHSTARIEGKTPRIYETYNWPEALKYLDLLPQEHKEAVGFIFLTHQSNTSLLEDSVQSPQDYFEGIYDYKNGELIALDLKDEVLMDTFFKKAQAFFGSLPERRLGVFGVGAATKIYAHDPKFADVYVPAQGSERVTIHEMGHVMDFKYDFTDLHDPVYSWTKDDALNNYGATHPGEDFAEAYAYYFLHWERFKALIQEKPERQKKVDFLEKYVFLSKKIMN